MMRYQLAGLDVRPVQTDVGYTFAKPGDRWVLVEDAAIDETLSEDGHRQPWDFQEVAVVRRDKVLVVVDKKEAALGQKIAKVSEGAVDAVRRHWPRPVERCGDGGRDVGQAGDVAGLDLGRPHRISRPAAGVAAACIRSTQDGR